MSGMSVATISSPEFIKITSVNPLISKCEIKVMYLGHNRNHGYISKAVAEQMAQTLPGTPIVGYYSETKEDFMDHGKQVTIDGEGVKFKCLTKPYGFVDINTNVWFQDFEDTDDFGNKQVRTYLMCEGYLWTGQYEEAKKIMEKNGKPHSMELDEDTLEGYWSEDASRGIDFYIVTDAIFSKLCALGDDVEPCFEGSKITPPEISKEFSLQDNNFSKTLFTMMEQLKEYTLNSKEQGGNSMATIENKADLAPENPVVQNSLNPEEISNKDLGKNEQQASAEINNNVEGDFTKKDEDEEKKEDEKKPSDDKKDESKGEEKKDEKEDDKKDEEKKKAPADHSLEEKFALLESQLSELTSKYAALEQENKELLSFKLNAEDKEKDALIPQFYMLSDEDKKDVIENKTKYSLDDIEAKLSIICVRKKVNFDNGSNADKENPATTFNLNSLNDNGDNDLPAWLKAVENHRQNI